MSGGCSVSTRLPNHPPAAAAQNQVSPYQHGYDLIRLQLSDAVNAP
jgi:hypothetical protein